MTSAGVRTIASGWARTQEAVHDVHGLQVRLDRSDRESVE